MKALVIAPQPFFSPRGTPFSVYYRTLVTSGLGVKIDLLTYGEGQDVVIPGVRIIRIPRFGFLGNVKVGPSLLKLFLDIFLIVWAIVLLIRNRYDVVHAHEEAVFFCRFLKPVFNFKLIYDMHSSLPQQLRNFNFTKSSFLIRIFKSLEDTCLHASDVVITICPDLARYVLSLVHDQKKHFLIENSIFEPVKLDATNNNKTVQAKLSDTQTKTVFEPPSNTKLVVYAGTLEPYQGIDILLNAFKQIVEERDDILLLIAGGREEQVKDYQDMAQRLGLTKQTIFTGQVSQSEARHYCSLAEVQLSPRSEGTNTPLKIYEQLASGIPLVATNIYSHTQAIDHEVAILVEPTAVGLANGILEALDPEGKGRLVANNAQQLYRRKYSRPVYESKMKAVIKALE